MTTSVDEREAIVARLEALETRVGAVRHDRNATTLELEAARLDPTIESRLERELTAETLARLRRLETTTRTIRRRPA